MPDRHFEYTLKTNTKWHNIHIYIYYELWSTIHQY